MGAQGTATVDFGAFPGKAIASVAVAQASITGTSMVEAWLYPTATADHSVDEHMASPIRVMARDVTNGVGFTIYALAYDNPGHGLRDANNGVIAKDGILLYGQWTVGWVWN